MAIGARHRSAIGLACGLLAAGASGSAEDLRPVPHHGSADHLGVASCASAACHGAVTPAHGGTVLQNEYTTWQTDDAHAQITFLIVSTPAEPRCPGYNVPARCVSRDDAQTSVCGPST